MQLTPTELNHLEQYRSIIDDWPLFLDTLQRPLPYTLWCDTSRIPHHITTSSLQRNNFALQDVGWRPATYRFTPLDITPGNSFEFRAGLIHIQEEIALTTVDALNLASLYKQHRAISDETFWVLDLCAAPGNKTIQAATELRQIGAENAIVVANDVDYNRLKAVRGAIDRLGLTNIVITNQDAVTFEFPARFHAVIVDVPCGCEGTVRKNNDAIFRSAIKDPQELYRLQAKILRRALDLTHRNGQLVYSTCTFAPEENECIIDNVLKSYPNFSIEPFDLGLKYAQGITSWRGVPLDPSLSKTHRYWPHLNDTGGFYVAKLRKETDSSPIDEHLKSASYSIISEDLNDDWDQLAEEMFGIPTATFTGYAQVALNQKKVNILPKALLGLSRDRFLSAGIAMYHTRMKVPKFATPSVVAFGGKACRMTVELDEIELHSFFRRNTQRLSADKLTCCPRDGYVIVTYPIDSFRLPIGLGMLRGTQNGSFELESYYPKAFCLNEETSAFSSTYT